MPIRPNHARSASVVTTASTLQRTPRVLRSLPRFVRHPLLAAHDRLAETLTPEWRGTTLLVWVVWFLMSFGMSPPSHDPVLLNPIHLAGYTMVNVYMPTLLEQRRPHTVLSARAPDSDALRHSLTDLLIYTLAGCPAPLIAAYLVQIPSLHGPRGILFLSTLLTALFYLLFALTPPSWTWITTVGANLCVTTMWAVLYSLTPELFDPRVRGTACGAASALSRVGGMAAPVVGGLVMERWGAKWTVGGSIVVLVAAGVGVLGMRRPDEEEEERKRSGYSRLDQA